MRIADALARFFASGFFVSHLPYRFFSRWALTGAGLFGTLLALLLSVFLPASLPAQTAVLALLIPFAVWISAAAEKSYGTHDDPRIVIDEIAGYAVAVFATPATLGCRLAAFVLFRVFDVWKPGWIRRSAKLPGGWGVVADDLLAGLAANVLLQIAFRFIAV